ncbi:hypothetical protein [Tropicimonas sp. S265A]|uniref:hypothetical protein n=1 Tax=Tropicimonas sp. S265A TaxID=3415134 RepID=UPI003C797290
MESISSEEQRIRAETNWEERLEKARAQREAVLRARAEEGTPIKTKPFGEPSIRSVEMAEKMRFGATSASVSPKVRAANETRAPWKRLVQISLGFCAGIGVGVGVMLVPDQLSLRDDVASTQTMPLTQVRDTAAAPPAEFTRAVATADPVQVPERGPSVLDNLTAEIVPLASFSQPTAPSIPRAVEEAGIALAALNIPFPNAPQADTLPDVGEPATRAVLQTPPIGIAATPRLQDTAPILTSFAPAGADAALSGRTSVATRPSLERLRADPSPLPVFAPRAGVAGLFTATPTRPELLASLSIGTFAGPRETGPDVAVAALDDAFTTFVQPDALGVAPAAGALPAAGLSPPAPAIPGATSMAMAIFAAGTVVDDAIETTQTVVESYGLPVVAIRRVGYRISQNHVRYYDASTAAAASLLATKIGGIARDFTRSGVNPEPGTLEIYLAGSSTAASRPARAPQPSAEDRLRNSVIAKLRGRLER